MDRSAADSNCNMIVLCKARQYGLGQAYKGQSQQELCQAFAPADVLIVDSTVMLGMGSACEI